MATGPDNFDAAYLRFIENEIRRDLKRKLLVLLEKEIDETIDTVLKQLEIKIKSICDEAQQRYLYDVVVRYRKEIENV